MDVMKMNERREKKEKLNYINTFATKLVKSFMFLAACAFQLYTKFDKRFLESNTDEEI